MKTLAVFIFLTLISVSRVAYATNQNISSSNINSEIRLVHEAFLGGNLRIMSIKVRDLLKLDSLSVYEKKNILSLINRSHGILGSSSIPTDWQIPQEIKDLTITMQTLIDPSGTSHQLVMEGMINRDKDLTGVQIMNSKNLVLLDTKDHDSQWGFIEISNDKRLKFTAKTDLHSALEQGLYFFKLNLVDKPFQGWFIYTESKVKSRNNLTQRANRTSVFQLSTTDSAGQRIENHQIVVKTQSMKSSESDYQVMRDAANRKILVMKRREEFASKDYIKMQSEDQSPNVLRLNHNTKHRFGDLTIRRLIATEVLIDKYKK